MIDDFKIENDEGYRYYDYDYQNVLAMECMGECFDGLHLLFPSTKSSEESGARRGCVIATNSIAMADKMRNIDLLRSWQFN